MSTEAIREAVKDAAGCLKGAEYLIERAYPEGDAPAGLLPAMVIAVAMLRAQSSIHERDGE